jgi:hypothetical protein
MYSPRRRPWVTAFPAIGRHSRSKRARPSSKSGWLASESAKTSASVPGLDDFGASLAIRHFCKSCNQFQRLVDFSFVAFCAQRSSDSFRSAASRKRICFEVGRRCCGFCPRSTLPLLCAQATLAPKYCKNVSGFARRSWTMTACYDDFPCDPDEFCIAGGKAALADPDVVF